MPIRRMPLVKDEIYHVYNKSIAHFKIFNDDNDYERMLECMAFYLNNKTPCKFSSYKILKNVQIDSIKKDVDIVAYCLMPTHIHLILRQNEDTGIERFVTKISQSYSQYFNVRHRRKGPLWEGRFKSVLVKNDDQLIHLTRYIHLNPATAFIIEDPSGWKYSSYNEYIRRTDSGMGLCNFDNLLEIDGLSYRKFVHDRIDYQRQLAAIKEAILED